MSEVIIIGLDIAKYVFHVPGADEQGRAIFSKRISRGKLLDFFAAHPRCTVALEAPGVWSMDEILALCVKSGEDATARRTFRRS